LSNGVKQASPPSDLDSPVLWVMWVDDHPKAVASYKRTIADWFSRTYTGANLQIEHAETANEALAKVKAGYFDLLVVDQELPGEKGSVLVKKLRDQDIYTDIIFYTRRVKIPDEVVTEVAMSGFAKVVLEQDLESATQTVIKGMLERFRKVSFLRGMVISKFIDVESALNRFLMSYFEIGDVHQDHFRTSILENSTISFGAKLNALLMIAFGKQRPRKSSDPVRHPFDSLGYDGILKGIQALRDVERNRNNLAHCAIRPREQLEVFTMGERVSYDRKHLDAVLTSMTTCLQFIDMLSDCLSSKHKAARTPNDSASAH